MKLISLRGRVHRGKNVTTYAPVVVGVFELGDVPDRNKLAIAFGGRPVYFMG
jgi:hypothetical protein